MATSTKPCRQVTAPYPDTVTLMSAHVMGVTTSFGSQRAPALKAHLLPDLLNPSPSPCLTLFYFLAFFQSFLFFPFYLQICFSLIWFKLCVSFCQSLSPSLQSEPSKAIKGPVSLKLELPGFKSLLTK